MQEQILPNGNSVGERLRSAILATGRKDRDIAASCGVQTAALSRYLSDEREPSAEALLKLSRGLKVSPWWVLFGEPDSSRGNVTSLWQTRAESSERKIAMLKKMLQEALAEL